MLVLRTLLGGALAIGLTIGSMPSAGSAVGAADDSGSSTTSTITTLAPDPSMVDLGPPSIVKVIGTGMWSLSLPALSDAASNLDVSSEGHEIDLILPQGFAATTLTATVPARTTGSEVELTATLGNSRSTITLPRYGGAVRVPLVGLGASTLTLSTHRRVSEPTVCDPVDPPLSLADVRIEVRQTRSTPQGLAEALPSTLIEAVVDVPDYPPAALLTRIADLVARLTLRSPGRVPTFRFVDPASPDPEPVSPFARRFSVDLDGIDRLSITPGALPRVVVGGASPNALANLFSKQVVLISASQAEGTSLTPPIEPLVTATGTTATFAEASVVARAASGSGKAAVGIAAPLPGTASDAMTVHLTGLARSNDADVSLGVAELRIGDEVVASAPIERDGRFRLDSTARLTGARPVVVVSLPAHRTTCGADAGHVEVTIDAASTISFTPATPLTTSFTGLLAAATTEGISLPTSPLTADEAAATLSFVAALQHGTPASLRWQAPGATTGAAIRSGPPSAAHEVAPWVDLDSLAGRPAILIGGDHKRIVAFVPPRSPAADVLTGALTVASLSNLPVGDIAVVSPDGLLTVVQARHESGVRAAQPTDGTNPRQGVAARVRRPLILGSAGALGVVLVVAVSRAWAIIKRRSTTG